MNYLDLYCKNVIKPIEDEVKRLRVKVYSKNIFDLLVRPLYKEYLEKNETFLFKCYEKLGTWIQDEADFQKELNDKFNLKQA